MRVYDFTYADNEGDEYQSNEHKSLSEAKAEIKRLKKVYDGDMHVTETWIYHFDEETGEYGDFIGRWDAY
jgi:hypothetical protein